MKSVIRILFRIYLAASCSQTQHQCCKYESVHSLEVLMILQYKNNYLLKFYPPAEVRQDGQDGQHLPFFDAGVVV